MDKALDVIVLGLGANGSSALYHLSKINKKVAGIDRFAPPHSFGSSHGQSRIIRQAYYEDPVYVPFIKEAYGCWDEIERISGKSLWLKTGGLMLGPAGAEVVTGSRLSAETHGIAYEELGYADLKKRFPAFRPTPDTIGILEKEAGILFPESCITTWLEQAEKNGAALHMNERMLKIIPFKDRVEVHTSRGTYTAEKCILSAGAWMKELVAGISPELQLPLTAARQPLYWFTNQDSLQQASLLPDRMPVYIWEYLPKKMFYGFPDLGQGIKIAYHHGGVPVLPDALTQDVSMKEIEDMHAIVAEYLNLKATFRASAVCMYTNTPDGDFLLDYHPNYNNIILASPCSGHGFKFSSVTGRILSEMAIGGSTSMDITPFAFRRLA